MLSVFSVEHTLKVTITLDFRSVQLEAQLSEVGSAIFPQYQPVAEEVFFNALLPAHLHRIWPTSETSQRLEEPLHTICGF